MYDKLNSWPDVDSETRTQYDIIPITLALKKTHIFQVAYTIITYTWTDKNNLPLFLVSFPRQSFSVDQTAGNH